MHTDKNLLIERAESITLVKNIQNGEANENNEGKAKTTEPIHGFHIRKLNSDNSNYPYCFELSGSIHKFFNSYNGYGEQNYSDFSFTDLCQAIEDFKAFFYVKESYLLNGLEIGINVSYGKYPTEKLIKAFRYYQQSPFSEEREENKLLYRAKLATMDFKIYDKAKQYQLAYPLIRFELVLRKFQSIEKPQTLDDLKNPLLLELLQGVFIEQFEKVFFYEHLFFNPNSDKEKSLIYDFTRVVERPERKDKNKKRTIIESYTKLANQYIGKPIKGQISDLILEAQKSKSGQISDVDKGDICPCTENMLKALLTQWQLEPDFYLYLLKKYECKHEAIVSIKAIKENRPYFDRLKIREQKKQAENKDLRKQQKLRNNISNKNRAFRQKIEKAMYEIENQMFIFAPELIPTIKEIRFSHQTKKLYQQYLDLFKSKY